MIEIEYFNNNELNSEESVVTMIEDIVENKELKNVEKFRMIVVLMFKCIAIFWVQMIAGVLLYLIVLFCGAVISMVFVSLFIYFFIFLMKICEFIFPF